jgi:hypothetical protein
MGSEQDFRVLQFETQGFHAALDERRGSFEACVDENIALRRRDEVAGQVVSADVIYVSDDAMGGKRAGPFRVRLGHAAHYDDTE